MSVTESLIKIQPNAGTGLGCSMRLYGASMCLGMSAVVSLARLALIVYD